MKLLILEFLLWNINIIDCLPYPQQNGLQYFGFSGHMNRANYQFPPNFVQRNRIQRFTLQKPRNRNPSPMPVVKPPFLSLAETPKSLKTQMLKFAGEKEKREKDLTKGKSEDIYSNEENEANSSEEDVNERKIQEKDNRIVSGNEENDSSDEMIRDKKEDQLEHPFSKITRLLAEARKKKSLVNRRMMWPLNNRERMKRMRGMRMRRMRMRGKRMRSMWRRMRAMSMRRMRRKGLNQMPSLEAPVGSYRKVGQPNTILNWLDKFKVELFDKIDSHSRKVRKTSQSFFSSLTDCRSIQKKWRKKKQKNYKIY